jgi:hypothetical protein
MEQNALLQGKIDGFPGYAGQDARRLSDEMVRSYLGEALAAAEERLAPGESAEGERLSDLLLRVAFGDQRILKAYEASERPGGFGTIAELDAAVVRLADRAATCTLADLGAYLNEVTGMLDQREAAMRGNAAPEAV